MRILLLLFFIISCSSSDNRTTKSVNEVYVPSKVTKYFMPEIPDWVNFDSVGECKRAKQIKYLNYANLHQSFNLSYEEIVQLQLRINENLSKTKGKNRNGKTSVQLEEKVFFQSKDEITQGIRSFKKPKVKKVHALWIDPALDDKVYRMKVKQLLSSNNFMSGHPVLISACLTQNQLYEYSANLGYGQVDFKMMSSEMFAPYDANFRYRPKFMVNISELIPQKNIILYTIMNRTPAIEGEYQVKKR